MKTEREKFERYKAQKIGIDYDVLKADLDDCERRFPNKRYAGWSFQEDWELWQAAKADAVPDGFKVVSFKKISELAVAVNKVDLMTHTEQKTNEVRLAWQDVASKLGAMLEAQEQSI